MKKQIVNIIVFILDVTLLLLSINTLTRTNTVDAEFELGSADLTSYDLGQEIVTVRYQNYLYYDMRFIYPGSFDDKTINEGEPATRESGAFTDYGTYRIVLALVPGRTYGAAFMSLDYSQRLYINGVLQEAVGLPGNTRAATVPASRFFTVYFTPDTNEVELVLHFANFYHREGGGPYPMHISEQHNISRRNQNTVFRVSLVIGCMLTIFLLYLGMYLFFERRAHLFYFSICCLTLAIRMLLTGEKPIMLLLPALPWDAAIGIEYLALIVMVFSAVSYIDGMFGKLMRRWVKIALYLISAAYALIVLFTEPLFYSRYLIVYQLLAGCVGVNIVISMTRSARRSSLENIMVYFGAGMFIIGAIVEIFTHGIQEYIGMMGTAEMGMLVFILSNMMAISMQFSRTEAELSDSRRNERELAQSNDMLERLNRMKSDFLSDISHEMNTPLTVLSGFAQLSVKELTGNGSVDDVVANLTMISSEAERLAELADQLLEATSIRESRHEHEPIDIVPLVGRVSALFAAIMGRKGNTVTFKAGASVPLVMANRDLIVQVLLNLLFNANRYTEESEITIEIRPEVGFVRLTVCDNGPGFAPEILPRVFDRYVKDSEMTTGLGLSICRDIVESHGGRIEAENRPEGGANVSFTLPVAKEET